MTAVNRNLQIRKPQKRGLQKRRARFQWKKYWQCYIMISVPLILIFLFNYLPMGGILMAFENFSFKKGLFGSEWVGVKHFKAFLTNPVFPQLMKNTLTLSVYSLAVSFPFPVLLALILNECGSKHFKKTVQLVTYAPNFISTVVLVGMLSQILHPKFGVVNNVLSLFQMGPVDFLGKSSLFPSLYVWSGVWQSAGYGSIIYIAALAGVDQELKEATLIDGANRLQRIWHLDLPTIKPTIITLLILSAGGIMSVGFEKVFLMQNTINAQVSEVISTYVYKRGLINNDYGYAAAVGLFNSAVNMILLVTVNQITKKAGENSLW